MAAAGATDTEPDQKLVYNIFHTRILPLLYNNGKDMNRGQSTLAIILWGVGITIPFVTGVIAWTAFKFDANAAQHEQLVSNVAILQTQSEQYQKDITELKGNIKEMNGKIDTLSLQMTRITTGLLKIQLIK